MVELRIVKKRSGGKAIYRVSSNKPSGNENTHDDSTPEVGRGNSGNEDHHVGSSSNAPANSPSGGSSRNTPQNSSPNPNDGSISGAPQNTSSPEAPANPAPEIPSLPRFIHPINFSPDFWNSLEKVWLTRRGLREVDRRNAMLPHVGYVGPAVRPRSLARFAMHGGPDLRHLRGYRRPDEAQSGPGLFAPPANPLVPSPRPEPLSAYDDNLKQYLAERNIYIEGEGTPPPGPNNINAILQRLQGPISSLTLARFSADNFEHFLERAARLWNRGVVDELIPIIAGVIGAPRGRDLQFRNFAPLADTAPVIPAPCCFDGAPADDIDAEVMGALGTRILPAQGVNALAVPNFVLEASAVPAVDDLVEKRRACYHGAYGARAMNVMQNYLEDEPVYDLNAYTFSATYMCGSGILTLYAHHMASPTTPGGLPRYYMTEVDSYAMRQSREEFIRGATAFRNARNLAAHWRDELIDHANTLNA